MVDSKLTNVTKIIYEGYTYAVIGLKYNNTNIPVILDWNTYGKIKKIDKKWYINDKGMVVTNHKIYRDNEIYSGEIYLHDVVLKINEEYNTRPILHINKIGVDNRLSNLMYDTRDKEINKNIKKKMRTLILPDEFGINVNNIPSFVWYVKSDDTHGDRFVINVGDINWKSTSSKKVSLRYKLEETKKYLRHLKNIRNDLFEEHSMNGDLNTDGQYLLNSFVEIVTEAGYNNFKKIDMNKTDKYLTEEYAGLSDIEINLLHSFDPANGRNDFR